MKQKFIDAFMDVAERFAEVREQPGATAVPRLGVMDHLLELFAGDATLVRIRLLLDEGFLLDGIGGGAQAAVGPDLHAVADTGLHQRVVREHRAEGQTPDAGEHGNRDGDHCVLTMDGLALLTAL